MKNSIAVFILSLLVCAGSAIAWPWGNVGLNVDDPQEQLDVGGNLLVRSNVVVRGGCLQLGEEGLDYPGGICIRSYNLAEGRYDVHGIIEESTFCFGAEGGPYFGFGLDGRIGGHVASPWYTISPYGDGVVFGNSSEGTNTASIKVSLDPPGFIFNVNGVIWTNTP